MEELLKQIDEKFSSKFDEFNSKAEDLTERLGAAKDDEGQKAVTAELEKLDVAVKELTAERDAELKDAEQKAMANEIVALKDLVETSRSAAHEGFTLGAPLDPNEVPGEKAFGPGTDDPSFFALAKAAANGDRDAIEKWENSMGEKAMGEGTGSTGGFLVPDQISGELLELREAFSVLRPLFSQIQVSSDTLRIPSITGGLVAAWVAEFAEKPVSDLTFGEISTNVFTKAGLAVASNQLLRDAKQSVDRLIYRDLARRLSALEELAYIAGTGTGQPRGIINTTGVQTEVLTSTDVLALLDAIVTAITNIYTNYFGGPSAIIMHPRTWGRIVMAREAATSANYLIGPPAGASNRRPTDRLPGYGAAALPRGELFGYPVYTSPNVPTNLGGATNESRVIVGQFSEGLVLDRDGVSLDSSEHVYFTSNQTVFRAEDSVGFTAARYPKAFDVIGGVGLAGG